MNVFEKTIRIIADLTVSAFGQGSASDSETGNVPIWSAVFVAVMGIAALSLVVVAAYALLAK